MISKIGKFFRGESSPPNAWDFGEILPSSVRYAIEHGGCNLGRTEVADTIANSSFPELGFYFLTKLLEGTGQQGDFIVEIANSLLVNEDFRELQSLSGNYLSSISESTLIQGGKSAQFSRSGEAMRNGFEVIAEDMKLKKQLPIFSLYAALLGLKPFVTGSNKPPKIILFNPKSEPEKRVGYILELQNNKYVIKPLFEKDLQHEIQGAVVSILDDTARENDMVVLEDHQKTGATQAMIARRIAAVLPNAKIKFSQPSTSG